VNIISIGITYKSVLGVIYIPMGYLVSPHRVFYSPSWGVS